ncbi:ArsR/SmtB family transcription factor [Thiomicrospira microaerophila]|uniref:ArsR/SmtB family transcription factor n=1 Tax=Thiomicrospira microaerophila TaxID=406020 RepID=UPI0005CAFE0A|nr:metalloregulator ArsR/SmtB family transcription factor [Thiomicrospira microaerophila]
MTVELTAKQFKALGHPARLRIVHLLGQQDSLCVCELMRVLAFGQSFSSRHLAILRDAGLVSTEKHGTWVHYRLTAAAQRLLHPAQLGDIAALQQDVKALSNVGCAVC